MAGRDTGDGTGYEANGGVLRFYAKGGKENHVAQIARANTVRVWAEPETGGEAYIPLSPSKRGRSTDILSAVAKEFGYGLKKMANGGYSIYGTYVGDYQNAGPGPGMYQTEDGYWVPDSSYPNSAGPRYFGQMHPGGAAEMQAGLGGSTPAYSPPRYSGSGTSSRSSGRGGRAAGGCGCDPRAIGAAVAVALRGMPQPVIQVGEKRLGEVTAAALARHRGGRL